jgi:hypothetical protein
MENLTATMALRLVAKTEFAEMTELDRDCYGGVEAADAMIGFNEDYTVILDGNRICLIDAEGVEAQFELGENIFA